jgi:hypothetical protein
MIFKGVLSYFLAMLRNPRMTLRVSAQIKAAMQGELAGSETALKNAADWLLSAQFNCPDGAGYSRRYRVTFGWDRGYVETTGYIIPTMLAVSGRLGDNRYRASALAAGEWLMQRQNQDGSFSEIDYQTPQAFDTGQVLIGLNALCREFPGREDYRQSAERAAAWLAARMNADGTWTRESFRGRAHTYYSRSGAALLETGIMFGRKEWVEASQRHLAWVIARQRETGWFLDCEFEKGKPALLHTIVYVMEGLLMAHEQTGRADYLTAVRRNARGLLATLKQAPRGLPVAYYETDWRPVSTELCVTGLAQWAGVCRRLDRLGNSEEFEGSRQRCLKLLTALQIRVPGALHGALPNVIPWWGSYGKMGAYNWNVKFLIDALLEK